MDTSKETIIDIDVVEEEKGNKDANPATDLDSSILSSQSLTSPCISCGRTSTKKDRVFECSKCKKLTHYHCTKLPAYAIYSLKSSKRQYVCATCSDPPDEYVKVYDTTEDEEKVTTKEVVNDLFVEIKRVADAVAKFDVQKVMESFQERIKLLDQVDSKLEVKVKAMETKLLEKLCERSTVAAAAEKVPCACEPNAALEEQLKAKESEISLLNDELGDAKKVKLNLERKNKDLMDQVTFLRNEGTKISTNLKQNADSYTTLKTEHDTQMKQMFAARSEINTLKVHLTDRDKTIHVLKNDKVDLSSKLDGLIQQFNTLKELMNDVAKPQMENQRAATTTDDEGDPDVIILHDSLFKSVKADGLMRREKQKVLLKWTPKLSNALETVTAMQEKPKVVMLHSGTNDLADMDENENGMLESIKSIYDVLEARGIKFVYSFILPRNGRDATGNAEVLNSRVVRMFAQKEDVFICRNDSFYWHGVQNERLFHADGVHVNDDGTRALVNQTKEVLCRSLDIEVPQHRFNSNNRYNRNNRNGGGRYRGNR